MFSFFLHTLVCISELKEDSRIEKIKNRRTRVPEKRNTFPKFLDGKEVNLRELSFVKCLKVIPRS